MCGVHKLTEYFFLPFLQRPTSSKIRVLALNEFHFIIELLLPATPCFIYCWSLSHIVEHELFCLAHLSRKKGPSPISLVRVKSEIFFKAETLKKNLDLQR